MLNKTQYSLIKTYHVNMWGCTITQTALGVPAHAVGNLPSCEGRSRYRTVTSLGGGLLLRVLGWQTRDVPAWWLILSPSQHPHRVSSSLSLEKITQYPTLTNLITTFRTWLSYRVFYLYYFFKINLKILWFMQ